MKQFRFYLSILFVFLSVQLSGQSSSPKPENSNRNIQVLPEDIRPESEFIVTFSEYPLGTRITNQYADQGLIFGGSGPFITGDGSNPTSPVLSGTPIFEGDISCTFVDPSSGEPVTVQSFSLDAGFFDNSGSTRIEWYDAKGQKIGQRTNTQFGIQTFTIAGGGIASWTISVIANEPAGFGIDNVSYVPTTASILFREKTGDSKDGSWGTKDDEIPGFDHVGFFSNGLVYESHPGYPTGTYVSADQSENIIITGRDGVQAQHTIETFRHDAKAGAASPVSDFKEIAIDPALAAEMQRLIEGRIGSGFQKIDFGSVEGIRQTLSPEAQKGGGGTFTCVGLIEWAAEQAGHNGGQGFIDNDLESVTISNPFDPTGPKILAPLLSPMLLEYSMKQQQVLENTNQWFQGFFDPVDFIITDPLGRRLGYTEATGEINEIPFAFYSGDGNIEQVLIPKSVPGPYIFELFGKDDDIFTIMYSADTSSVIRDYLAKGDTIKSYIMVEAKTATLGDVNEDGEVDQADVNTLITLQNTYVDYLGHPGDLNGDGLLSSEDVNLLEKLIENLNTVPDIPPYVPPMIASAGQLLSDDLQVSITPQPFSDLVEISIANSYHTEAILVIYDLKGRELTSIRRSKENADIIFSWDSSSFAEGVYLYTVKTGNSLKTGKLVLKR